MAWARKRCSLPVGQVEAEHTAAGAVLHDQVDGKILDKEFGLVADRLLVERVQHRMAGAIGRGTGALRDALAVVRGHAAKGTLVDPAILGARERHAIVLELNDRRPAPACT